MDPFAIRSILVGTDLTPRSDVPLRAAAAIAELTGARLHILHAFELEALPADAAREPATFPERVASARRALDEQIRRVVPSTLSVASRLVEIYLPHKALLAQARRVSADVIVLGRREERNLSGRLLGTTADRVVRESGVPCLVVADDFTLPLRDVVAPLDPLKPAGEVARIAMRWAAGLGAGTEEEPGTELHLLSILPSTALAAVQADEVSAMAALDSAVGEADIPAHVQTVATVRREDSPAIGILEYADEVDADLIALGTRAPGKVSRALIGSVSSAVTREATAPVLLIPPVLWRDDGRG